MSHGQDDEMEEEAEETTPSPPFDFNSPSILVDGHAVTHSGSVRSINITPLEYFRMIELFIHSSKPILVNQRLIHLVNVISVQIQRGLCKIQQKRLPIPIINNNFQYPFPHYRTLRPCTTTAPPITLCSLDTIMQSHSTSMPITRLSLHCIIFRHHIIGIVCEGFKFRVAGISGIAPDTQTYVLETYHRFKLMATRTNREKLALQHIEEGRQQRELFTTYPTVSLPQIFGGFSQMIYDTKSDIKGTVITSAIGNTHLITYYIVIFGVGGFINYKIRVQAVGGDFWNSTIFAAIRAAMQPVIFSDDYDITEGLDSMQIELLRHNSLTTGQCYHPLCENMVPEKQSFRCKGCNVATYCRRLCRKNDWNKRHRYDCKTAMIRKYNKKDHLRYHRII